MRVTGGEWRSRRLAGPRRGQPLRPTPDALRERAFAVLGEAVAGTVFLDLFAGTGSVGIEALSRGARQAVFVEAHRTAAALVRRNLEALAVPADRWRILTVPASRALARLAREGVWAGLAWADPPFERWEEGLDALLGAWRLGVLEPEAPACLECPARAGVAAALPAGVTILRELGGGASRLVILEGGGPRS